MDYLLLYVPQHFTAFRQSIKNVRDRAVQESSWQQMQVERNGIPSRMQGLSFTQPIIRLKKRRKISFVSETDH